MRVAASSAESNVGRKRRHNEDNFVAAPPVFAVADGMGGAQAGEVASALAASAVTETPGDPDASGIERVVGLIKAANLRVHQRAVSDPMAQGMGTTMTVALLQPDGDVAIGHVGDSRAYLLRDNRLEQLTDDHSLVAELVRRGELTPQEAAVHPQRSVITRALGTEADVDVDAFTVEAQDGDLFLLCSDGLTTMVDADTIARILVLNRARLPDATHALIKAANDRGGDDNITAILFAVADGDVELATSEEPTVEHVVPFDDEDTLHPEDNVRLPLDIPPAEVTMVVPADEIARALETQAPAPVQSEADTAALPAAPTAAATAAWWRDQSDTAAAPEEAGAEGGEDAEPEAQASALRLAIAGLVIVVLSAAIVLLVLDALPR
jgi:protein phosphatase